MIHFRSWAVVENKKKGGSSGDGGGAQSTFQGEGPVGGVDEPKKQTYDGKKTADRKRFGSR